MRDDLGNCDYCGTPIDFYGCPKHGVDCYECPHDSSSGSVDGQWRCDECGAVVPSVDGGSQR